ncbi:MAG: tetratricopeptide repeat protein, partial [Planctomycetota bacterium]|nr:tetratricopeptide repeat protein [Planctomycetota bacterium]
MTTFARWMVLAALALGLGGPAFGQKEAAPRGQDRFGWSGRVQDPATLERQLEDAVVRMINRDFAGAEAILDEIWMRSTALQSFSNQPDLMVRIALARSELYETQGRMAEALATLDRLLLDPADPRWAEHRDELVLASEAFHAKEDFGLLDVRVVVRRNELKKRGDPAIQGLEETIRANVEAGDFRLVWAVGARAIPILSEIVLEDPDNLTASIQADPLKDLIALGERHAADLILRNFDKGGYAWHQRIIRAMKQQDVLENDEKWSGDPQATTGRTFLVPAWLEILERLLERPGTAREAMGLVGGVIRYDGLTPALVAALQAALDSPDADLVQDTLGVLKDQGRRYSTKPVLEHAVAHPDAHVRRFAAEKLRWYESSSAFYDRAQDPDPVVRHRLAFALGNRWFERS